MVELRFRIRNNVFAPRPAARRSTIRPLALLCPSVEEAALLGEVDEGGRLIPRRGVFSMSAARTGPVIEGFEDCALGEFVRAQLEALSQNGEPPARCEVHGLDPFLDLAEPQEAERLRDLISVCEFRANEFTPESAVRFLKDSGFFDEFIIVGVKRGTGWRRSRCITTFEGRPGEASTILGHLADYFGKEQQDDKPRDDRKA
ncbi:MAG TPA: hypothetical protein VFY29_09565 [Terriglobia bacterium]|nr:hypothetical protein [Terriglobia bacterium]